MFPIRDHNPSNRTPYVTWAIMALNIGIFISYWGLMDQPMRLAGFYYDWAMTPGLVVAGEKPVTLITSMFLHGGVMHLAGNMLFLWIFGDNMEDELGHIGFALFYLASGVCASLAQVMADPASLVPVVGASGAIAGVMGGYLLLFPKAKVDILFILIVVFKVIPVPAWIMLGLWFALQLFNGITADVAGSGVAYWAHAGGFLIGFALMLPAWKRRGGTEFWDRTDGHPPHPDAEYTVSKSGIPTVRRRR